MHRGICIVQGVDVDDWRQLLLFSYLPFIPWILIYLHHIFNIIIESIDVSCDGNCPLLSTVEPISVDRLSESVLSTIESVDD